MSEVRRALVAGENAAGLAHYRTLASPTAEDHRWAGLCAFNLGQLLDARDLLLQARAGGCHAANIDLATVHRQLGEPDDAWALLAQVNPDALDAFDRTLYWREVFVLRFGADDLIAATQAVERAWTCTFESPDAQALRAGIGQCLGMVYAARGQDRRAESYLTAALETATPARKSYIYLARASSRSRSGHHEDGRVDLEAALRASAGAPGIQPVLAYHQGMAAWNRGDLEAAAGHWRTAASAAAQGLEPETECYAHLGLVAVHTARGDLASARGHLARAEMTQVNPVTRALTTLRRGTLAVRAGDIAGLALLEEANDDFVRLQRGRESGWAALHLAAAHLATGDAAAAILALTRATDGRHALGSGAAFVPELRGLPRLQAFLAQLPAGHYLRTLLEDARTLEGTLPFEVRLITLGSGHLLVDGLRARLDLARSPEVLAYVLRYPGRTLAQIAAVLAPDEDPKRTKNYLHQARYDVEKAAPGITIPPDAARTYAVRSTGPVLSWDVLDVEAALKERSEGGLDRALSLYGGPFLPEADSTWASEERADLGWGVIKVGLELTEEWYAAGEYAKCVALTGRLLEIDPYDDALGGFLVRAARSLTGDAAARGTVNRLLARHAQDMGSMPPALVVLQRELNLLN